MLTKRNVGIVAIIIAAIAGLAAYLNARDN
jgi:hypothetical protein